MRYRKIYKFKIRYFLLFLSVIIFFAVFTINLFLSRQWDGKDRYTVIINSNPLGVFSIEPAQKRAAFFTIPDNTLLDVPFGYGKYKAGAIFSLGELDKSREKGILLEKSIENTLGIYVNGYIDLNSSMSGFINLTSPSELEDFKREYFSFSGLKNFIFLIPKLGMDINSDIPLIDFINLWKAIKSLRNDQIIYFDLAGKNVFIDDVWPDQTVIKNINIDQFDIITKDSFENADIRRENIPLEIINATEKGGLAAQFSRILAKSGANVLIKSNAAVNDNFNCRILLSKEENKDKLIVAFLKKNYNCEVESKVTSLDQVDIRIILGEKFLK